MLATVSFVVVEDVAASWEQYGRFADALDGPAPAGLILHAAGPTDEGFRIVGVWESEEAWRSFATQLDANSDSPEPSTPFAPCGRSTSSMEGEGEAMTGRVMYTRHRSRLIGCTVLMFVFACFMGASSASADVRGRSRRACWRSWTAPVAERPACT